LALRLEEKDRVIATMRRELEELQAQLGRVVNSGTVDRTLQASMNEVDNII
jgi:hypothetical protein